MEKRWHVAGVEGAGASDAWWETGLTLEDYQLSCTGFSGSAADIFKCFDQVSRPLLYHIAKIAGLTSCSLQAYIQFQETLKIHNTLALGVGEAHQRENGIPPRDVRSTWRSSHSCFVFGCPLWNP